MTFSVRYYLSLEANKMLQVLININFITKRITLLFAGYFFPLVL